MNTIVEKICNGCGIDVAQQKRVKDPQGRYYCHSCWGSMTRASAATPPSRPQTLPPAFVAPSGPEAAPVSQPPDQKLPSAPVEVREPSVKIIPSSGMKRLWQNRWARWGSIITIVLVAVLIVPAVKAYRQTQEDKAAMDANAKSGADMFKRMAESSERQAEASRKEAARLRGEANALRGSDDPVAVPAGPKNKTEAINADDVIMGYIDQRPELASLIKIGGTQLDAHLQLLFMQDVLTASDLRYIRRFCAKISSLPTY